MCKGRLRSLLFKLFAVCSSSLCRRDTMQKRYYIILYYLKTCLCGLLLDNKYIFLQFPEEDKFRFRNVIRPG